jgi:hypothetical protein
VPNITLGGRLEPGICGEAAALDVEVRDVVQEAIDGAFEAGAIGEVLGAIALEAAIGAIPGEAAAEASVYGEEHMEALRGSSGGFITGLGGGVVGV